MGRPTLTVVIPTLNEAAHLPVLLGMLEAQTRPPDAVVVADAGSTDATRDLALAAGARVVEGGPPAVGRNAGAAAALTDLILFLDADDEPAENWIELAVAEFEQRELFAAAGQVEPLEDTPANVVACEVVNLYLQLMQYVVPHAPGFCILVRREVHEQIGGFDETVVLAEDHEYVQRAAEVGKFRILQSAPMRTSMRRIEKEGLITLSFKYLYSELYVVSGRPIKSVPFEYEFAAFGDTAVAAENEGVLGGEFAGAPAAGGRFAAGYEAVLVDFAALRDRLGAKAEEPVTSLSEHGLEKVQRIGTPAATPETIGRRLADFAPEEIRELHRYVARRIDIARRMPPIVLRRVRRAGDKLKQRIAEKPATE